MLGSRISKYTVFPLNRDNSSAPFQYYPERIDRAMLCWARLTTPFIPKFALVAEML